MLCYQMQLGKTFFFGFLFLILFAPSGARADVAKTIARCDELKNNSWEQAVASKGWEVAAADFHTKMDHRFEKVILGMNLTDNKNICGDYTDILRSANLRDFVSMDCADGAGGCEKGVLQDPQEFQCALFHAFQSENLNQYIDPSRQITQDDVYNVYNQRRDRIATEIENVGISMKISLFALREMQAAYVLHKSFLCVIQNLELMRNELRDFMEQAVRIPGKFINCGFEE